MSVQHSISHSLLSLKLTERRTLSPALELLDAGYDSTEHGVTLEEDMQSPQHNIQMCRCRSPLCGLVVFWLFRAKRVLMRIWWESALWTHFPWVIMRHVNFTDDLQTREDFCSFVLKSSKLREWTRVKNCCSALSVHSSISKANGTTYNVL